MSPGRFAASTYHPCHFAQRRLGDRLLRARVFPSRAGTHLRHSAVWTHGHVKARAAAGVHPRLRIHDLRHTAATLWLAAGESIYFVKEQLGHADIRTTIDIYGHRDQEAAAAAAARAAAWWRNPAGTTSGTTGAISARDPRENREATTGIEPV